MSRVELGKLGEDLACLFIRRKEGMRVLYRNFRAPRGGEVDIVCRDRNVLVFVEVKTRSSLVYGRPAEAVNADKERLITRGALEWLRLLNFPQIDFRFDIVEVLIREGEIPEINRLGNAFELPEPYYYGAARPEA